MRYFSLVLVVALFSCQPKNNDSVTSSSITGESIVDKVNVFLGTSGDHGQVSPAASYPFSMLSIGPHTYPSTHTGYEYLAKEFLGFSHTRLEGVGCQGSGGNLLVTPFLGDSTGSKLIKKSESASPGYYSVAFTSGIKTEFTVAKRYGIHHYQFPQGSKGLKLDLSYATVNRFQDESHQIEGNTLTGWIDTRTTCSAGQYRIYFYLEFDQAVEWEEVAPHQLFARVGDDVPDVKLQVGLSSVNEEYARQAVKHETFEEVKAQSKAAWEMELDKIEVKGPADRMNLFYSLLYRAIQSPYLISEDDGYYRAIDGSVQQTEQDVYHGWAIWDNYRTQLPLLSLVYPERYQSMAASIANLYPYEKKDFATEHEPSLTVRTEHAMVVLWDALQKGYEVDLAGIKDSLIAEMERIDTSHPDKALEAAYDAWALSGILGQLGDEELSNQYHERALMYKDVWKKDFADLTKGDVDRMGARGMYQGTIWQYRWFVPFDQKGLMELAGGEKVFLKQLDEFFDGDYYNHANQPDLQTSGMYQGTSEPWKSQQIIHKIAVDTMIQHYFNNNSRGTGSYIGKIYQNQPAAYLSTMDDDAGTMSSWYVWASCGLFPACVGEPVYYLHAPLMEEVNIKMPEGKSFDITVKNFNPEYAYIQNATLNGEILNRNWLTHAELMAGGHLEITTGDLPNKTWGVEDRWMTKF